MKKFYVPVIALIFLSAISVMVSCKKNSFLGATSTTNLTKQVIFTDSAYTEGFLANIYSNMGFATSPSRFTFTTASGEVIPCGGLDAAGDESQVSHLYSTTAFVFAIGAVNQINVSDDVYNTCYTEIHAINQLLKNIHTSPLQASTQVQRVAEARFLRAWYYAILMEHYGGVRIVGDSIYNYTQPINTRRNSFAATVNYITSECDAVEPILPLLQVGPGVGRASGGACLALKARVLLYAASPLFNKPAGPFGAATNLAPSDQAVATTATTITGKMYPVPKDTVASYVSYPTYDVNRWQLAANAALAVINSGQYQLFTDSANLAGYGEEGAFQYLFTQRTNIEYILQLDDNEPGSLAANYLEGLFQPPSRTGANGAFPYQGTVDAFTMANGKAITDPTSGYDPTHPYNNRDPRLKYSIIYDQGILPIRSSTGQIPGYSPVNIYLNVINGVKSGGQDAVYQGTPTGYYNNKMLDPGACSECGLGAPTQRTLPLMRYAEILLDYAEAENEMGIQTYGYTEIEALRKRAGISANADGLYGLQAGMSQTQMRAAIQAERRVELAYEGNRFFDVRRWLIADQTENIQTTGMEVDHIGTDTTYNIFNVLIHHFNTKMYLFPFPQKEIGKGGGIVQNPGY